MSQPLIKEFQIDITASGNEAKTAAALFEDGQNISPNSLTQCAYGGGVSAPAIFYEEPAGEWTTGTSPYSRIIVPAGVNVVRVTASCYLTQPGGTNDANMSVVLALKKNGSFLINGRTYSGYGQGSTTAQYVTEDDNAILITPWISANPGDYFEIWAWHNNVNGVCNFKDLRFQVEGMYLEGSYSCYTEPSIPGYLWAWGINDDGELGLSDTVSRSSPVRVGALSSWIRIRIDDGRDGLVGASVALRDDGTIWGWGSNRYGNIGDGTIVGKSSPVRIGTMSDWRYITINDESAFAINESNELWAWGDNTAGALGLGDTIHRSSPVQVGTLTDWCTVDNYHGHGFGIKTDGSLWAWGDNGEGYLGLGDISNRSSPVRVGALNNWAKIATGTYFTLAIKTDGSLWSWGENGYGQLGIGSTTHKSSPVQVGTLTDWAQVSTGIWAALAIKTDGSLWAWGYNNFGQLGIGNTQNRSSPVRVGSLTDWKYVEIGDYVTLATKIDGSLWAWGRGTYGALGLGTLTNRSSPVRVGTATDWITVNACSRGTFGLRT